MTVQRLEHIGIVVDDLTGRNSGAKRTTPQVDHHTARARVAAAEEKPELWRIMTASGAPYDEFQA